MTYQGDFAVEKNVRVEYREDVFGRVRERTVTTWDVVQRRYCRILSEHCRKRDALAAMAEEYTARTLAR